LPPDLIRQYKKQQLFELKILHGIESLDPEINQFSSIEMGKLIDSLIPIDTRHRLLPTIAKRDQATSVLVAMVEPDNLEAQDHLTGFCLPAWRCNAWYYTGRLSAVNFKIPG